MQSGRRDRLTWALSVLLAVLLWRLLRSAPPLSDLPWYLDLTALALLSLLFLEALASCFP